MTNRRCRCRPRRRRSSNAYQHRPRATRSATTFLLGFVISALCSGNWRSSTSGGRGDGASASAWTSTLFADAALFQVEGLIEDTELERCHDALRLAGGDRVDKDEYVSFIREYTGGDIEVLSFELLPLTLIQDFTMMSCVDCERNQVLFRTIRDRCCDGPDEYVVTTTDTDYDESNVIKGCASVSESVRVFREANAQPSPSPAPTRFGQMEITFAFGVRTDGIDASEVQNGQEVDSFRQKLIRAMTIPLLRTVEALKDKFDIGAAGGSTFSNDDKPAVVISKILDDECITKSPETDEDTCLYVKAVATVYVNSGLPAEREEIRRRIIDGLRQRGIELDAGDDTKD